MGSQAYSRPVREMKSIQDVDNFMGDLQARCKEWRALSIKKKVALLKAIRARALKACSKLGEATAKTSGFVSEGHPEVVHQEAANMNALFVGPMIAKTANAYIKQLEEIRCTGFVTPVQVARKTEDGRNVIDRGLWPNKQDILLQGSRTYVYTQADVELTQGGEAAAEKASCRDGVAVVLGAGNQPFLSIEDTLHMLFDKHLPVLLKHHPAQAKVAPFWEYVLQPLAEAGFYQGVLADITITQEALYHTRTAAVHITGSEHTYNTILYGPGKEGVTRKAAIKPLLTVPFSSELGNVTPVFVTPAKWSQVDMKQAAQSIAFGTTLNAGCNCIAPKVIVMSAEWSQADAFEAVVKAHFRRTPAAPCWYPGAKARYTKFLDAHPDCDTVPCTIPEGHTYSAEVLPWAMHSVTITSEKQAAAILGLQEEFFAPALIFLRIPGDEDAAASAEAPSATITRHTKDFLRRIPAFSDKYLWGNLACTLYVPDSVKTVLPENVQKCVDSLRYGSIVINNAPFVAYSNHLGAWGGHMGPESGPNNPGSGLGKLHNFAQIDNVEKQVFEFPWGSTIDLGDKPIPTFLVKPIAGLTGDGFRGLWAAITP